MLRLCDTQWPNSGLFLQNALVEYIGVYSDTNYNLTPRVFPIWKIDNQIPPFSLRRSHPAVNVTIPIFEMRSEKRLGVNVVVFAVWSCIIMPRHIDSWVAFSTFYIWYKVMSLKYRKIFMTKSSSYTLTVFTSQRYYKFLIKHSFLWTMLKFILLLCLI